MDKIILRDMVFYGYHGVFAEENKLGQRFIVSVELLTDLRKAGSSDCVEDTTSYAEVYGLVKNQVENKCYKLLEALAENIAAELLEKCGLVGEVMISVKKPGAPVPGVSDYFGVEIRRSRSE